MSCFKFGNEEIESFKDFYKQKEVTGIFRVLVSDRVSSNDGNDWRYIVGYQVDGERSVYQDTK